MKSFGVKTYTDSLDGGLTTTQHYNDLFLVNGSIFLGEDIEALKYALENVLKTQMGELQLDTQKGIPYFQTIFSHQTNVKYWEVYMIDAIEKVDGVVRCESFTIDIDNEKNLLTYVAHIKTIFGDLTLNG